MMRRGCIRLTALLAVALPLLLTATPSRADPASDLSAEIVSLRTGAGCPAPQEDPRMEQVAQMASENTRDYAGFRTSAVPFTDPAPALAAIGHPAATSILLSGYGPTEVEAVRGVTVHYQALKPDCSYQRFGASLLYDEAGFYVASAVLATP